MFRELKTMTQQGISRNYTKEPNRNSRVKEKI